MVYGYLYRMHFLDQVHNAFLALVGWWMASWVFFSRSVSQSYSVTG